MNFLKNWFYPAKDKPEKKKVCWLLLGKILNELLFLSEKETDQIADLDDTNPKVLQEIIREVIVPNYHYYSRENQERIKDSLMYYLITDKETLERIFPSHYVPIDSTSGELFYTLVWKELYGTDYPGPINPSDYEEDCSAKYVNSLTQDSELYKKFNPNDERPSVANVIARLKQNP